MTGFIKPYNFAMLCGSVGAFKLSGDHPFICILATVICDRMEEPHWGEFPSLSSKHVGIIKSKPEDPSALHPLVPFSSHLLITELAFE